MRANPYPNSWYVMRHYAHATSPDHIDGIWTPLLDSVGNKSYAMGYLNGVCSVIPRPMYRLINNKGELFEQRHGAGPVNLNTAKVALAALNAAEPAQKTIP